MNYNTFLIRYGIDPKCFKNKELFPIKTDTGYLYYLEQETETIRRCPNQRGTSLQYVIFLKNMIYRYFVSLCSLPITEVLLTSVLT